MNCELTRESMNDLVVKLINVIKDNPEKNIFDELPNLLNRINEQKSDISYHEASDLSSSVTINEEWCNIYGDIEPAIDYIRHKDPSKITEMGIEHFRRLSKTVNIHDMRKLMELKLLDNYDGPIISEEVFGRIMNIAKDLHEEMLLEKDFVKMLAIKNND